MNNAIVLFMENKSFQLSTKLNLPNTIAERAKAFSFLCSLILKTEKKKKSSRRDMFIQVINILAGVRNYSYLDLLQKPS